MAVRFASIVEGHGELRAVPVLIRRILAEIDVNDATILGPVGVRRDKLLKDSDNELSRAVSFAIAKLGRMPGRYSSRPTAKVLALLIFPESCVTARSPHVQICPVFNVPAGLNNIGGDLAMLDAAERDQTAFKRDFAVEFADDLRLPAHVGRGG